MSSEFSAEGTLISASAVPHIVWLINTPDYWTVSVVIFIRNNGVPVRTNETYFTPYFEPAFGRITTAVT